MQALSTDSGHNPTTRLGQTLAAGRTAAMLAQDWHRLGGAAVSGRMLAASWVNC